MVKLPLTQKELVEKFDNNCISKQELGKLRRMLLERILSDIALGSDEAAKQFLDKKRSKLDRAKLALMIGYKTKPVNLRQSFKTDIEQAEKGLKARDVIVAEAKSNAKIHDDNVTEFLAFIEDRLAMTPLYHWPVNNKGRLYHRRIWACYLNQSLDEIKSAPTFFYKDDDVKATLADIDAKLANEDILKTLDYASDAALDEMNDNMTSAALSKYRQQIKEANETLAAVREEKRQMQITIWKLEQELNLFKLKQKRLKNLDGKADIKLMSVR